MNRRFKTCELMVLAPMLSIISAATGYAAWDALKAADYSASYSTEWDALAFVLATTSGLLAETVLVILIEIVTRLVALKKMKKYRIKTQWSRIKPWWKKMR